MEQHLRHSYTATGFDQECDKHDSVSEHPYIDRNYEKNCSFNIVIHRCCRALATDCSACCIAFINSDLLACRFTGTLDLHFINSDLLACRFTGTLDLHFINSDLLACRFTGTLDLHFINSDLLACRFTGTLDLHFINSDLLA